MAMATTLLPTATFTSFANVSSTSTLASCGPCTSMQIYDLWHGSWAQQNSSLPALRTLQPIINPVDNTTLTSTICNSAALPAYSDNGSCQDVYLSDECELLCVDLGGRGSGLEPYTITLSGTSGNYLQWAGDFRIQGAITTTNSAGASICASSNLTPETSIYKYYGPTIRASNADFFGGSLLVMPELTKSYPNEGAYAQCSYFQTGPPPIALTAVNEIVLPVLTLPSSTTEDESQTTSGPSTTSSTRIAQPGPSEVGQIPSQTSVSRTADATSSPGQNSGSAPPPRPSEESEEQEDSPSAPGSPPQEATINTRPAGDGQPTTTASSGGGPPVDAPPGDNDEDQEAGSNAPVIPAQGATTNTPPNPSGPSSGGAPPPIALPAQSSNNDQNPPEVVVGGSTTISAGGRAAAASGTTFSVLPSASGIIGIADGETMTLPLPAPAPVSNFIRPVTSAGQQGFVVAGPTITPGGYSIVVSGTSYTALPSGSGIVAIDEAGSTTLQPSQLASLGINTLPGSEGGYLFTDQTLSIGGSAFVIAGATYSALPKGSGIAVAASGSSSIIAVTEATNIPGLGEVEVLDQPGGVYVLDGSVTVSAGGTPVTISNTVYSALPSGFGVLAAPDSEGDEFAPYIEQGVSGSDSDGQQDDSYIIGAALTELLSDNGASVITVSGVVYSALPSGSGVLVVANGTSTTIAVNPTEDGGSYGPKSTGSSDGSDSDEFVVPFTGASSPGKHESKEIGWAVYLGFLVMLGMCLVF